MHLNDLIRSSSGFSARHVPYSRPKKKKKKRVWIIHKHKNTFDE